jgi:hypothetical protein
MEELRRDESLTTADIAQADRTRESSTTVIDDRDTALLADRELQDDNRTPVANGLEERDTHNASNAAAQPSPQSPVGQLFPDDELHNFRARWDQVQTSFVDEPRKAVEQADTLVANVVKRIAEQFSSERSQLEKQWDRGDNVSTEDLRQALKRYRSFFDRLLSF